MAYQAFPRATDPVPPYVKPVAVPELKQALSIMTPPAKGGPGTETAPPPMPPFKIDPGAVEPFDHALDAFMFGMMTGGAFKLDAPIADPNPIAFDPSGKDWEGIKAVAAREALEGRIPPPDFGAFGGSVPTTRQRIAPRGILTEWDDSTSRPSLWAREP